jgi:hypothetical protein
MFGQETSPHPHTTRCMVTLSFVGMPPAAIPRRKFDRGQILTKKKRPSQGTGRHWRMPISLMTEHSPNTRRSTLAPQPSP